MRTIDTEKIIEQYRNFDPVTYRHGDRVCWLVEKLADELNIQKDCRLCMAAMFHDIGKTGVPEKILNKPGKLTTEEYEIIKEHARIGYELTEGIFCPEVRSAILYHHENEDGTGYFRKCSIEIPPISKLIHVCDVYDALTSDRPYREAMSRSKALLIMTEEKGHYDREMLGCIMQMSA